MARAKRMTAAGRAQLALDGIPADRIAAILSSPHPGARLLMLSFAAREAADEMAKVIADAPRTALTALRVGGESNSYEKGETVIALPDGAQWTIMDQHGLRRIGSVPRE